MIEQELEYLKGLFNKKKSLEQALGDYDFPTDASFKIKSINIEVSFYGKQIDSSRTTRSFNSIPITHDELRYFFHKRKNEIMLQLYEINHQIDKIKIQEKK